MKRPESLPQQAPETGMDATTGPGPHFDDDLALVSRSASGDRRAFEALMHRHNQRLYRAVRSILRDEADAEEAVQDAWWKAYTHLREFRADARVSTWLTRIALNEALMKADVEKKALHNKAKA